MNWWTKESIWPSSMWVDVLLNRKESGGRGNLALFPCLTAELGPLIARPPALHWALHHQRPGFRPSDLSWLALLALLGLQLADGRSWDFIASTVVIINLVLCLHVCPTGCVSLESPDLHTHQYPLLGFPPCKVRPPPSPLFSIPTSFTTHSSHFALELLYLPIPSC